MAGYAKLFSSITASTIWGEDNATRIVWITMMAMADATGYVGASIPGLARIANVSHSECERAIAKFLAPDPHSRNQSNGGRRVEAVDRGWVLLNYAAFRETRDPDARRDANKMHKRAQRAREKAVKLAADNADSTNLSQVSAVSAHAEAASEANAVHDHVDLGPEGEAILAELGDKAFAWCDRQSMAEEVLGYMMANGKPLSWHLKAIQRVATKVTGAKLAGDPWPPARLGSYLMTTCRNPDRPRQESEQVVDDLPGLSVEETARRAREG